MSAWSIMPGDCRESLATLDPGCVQTCVTSPPYFGLRDYGHDGQIGLEPTPDEFVAALVEVFRAVRRVLRDDGTVWLNLGDSYAGSWGAQSRGGPPSESSTLRGNGHVGGGPKAKSISAVQIAAHPKGQTNTGSIPKGANYKPKDLLMVPAMAALALRADGWYLRDEIIWAKPAPMPTSARDRTCRAHEVIYLLTKRKTYYYDQQAIAEPAVSDHDSGNGYARPEQLARGGRGAREAWRAEDNPTRIKRSVWTVGTANFGAAHFATFPPKLIEPCILAGCPEGGVVLDPFAGAGTTGMVALRHNRSFLGCELNPEYVRLARDRIIADAPLLNTHTEAAA
jgi:DNA modification methylase